MALLEDLWVAPPRAHAAGRHCFSLALPALQLLDRSLRPGMRTLEVGCGASTVVFAAAGTDHTTISPDAFEHDTVREWCAERDVDISGVTFVAESSHAVLPTSEGELDLVLIDGAHGFPYPILDWFHTQHRLKVGGLLLIDDAFIPTVGVVVRHLRSSPQAWELVEVAGDRLPVFRKLSDDLPPFHDWGRYSSHASFSYLPLARRMPAATKSVIARRVPYGIQFSRWVGRQKRRRRSG